MVLGLIVVGTGAFAAMNPGVVKAFQRGIDPDDRQSGRRSRCPFMQDHKFNRLDADQRDGCDKRLLQSLGEVIAAEQPDINIVDLRRDAVQGSMPRNGLPQYRHAPHAPCRAGASGVGAGPLRAGRDRHPFRRRGGGVTSRRH